MTLPLLKQKKLTILIISHAFPPMNATASHRPYSWVKTWQKMGHNVHVLTTRKYPFDGTMDLNYDLSGIQIHTVDYLGINNNHHRKCSFEDNETSSWEKIKTITRRLRFGIGMFADLRMLSLFPLIQKGNELIRTHKINFVVSTYPPDVVHLAARWLASQHNIPWLADYRDLWFQEGRLYQFSSTTAISDIIHRKILKKAHIISTVSEGLAVKLKNILNRNIVVSYNGFIEPPNAIIEASIRKETKKHIIYTGRLYPKKRDPDLLFQALSLLCESDAEVISKISIDFYGFDGPFLNKLIDTYGIDKCVNNFSFVPYQESLNLQRTADALIFLDWLESDVEGILSGKLFEYLNSGRPVICIGNRMNTEAARLIRLCRCGVVLSSATKIADYLQKIIKTGVSIDPDWNRIQSFSRENQAISLIEAVTKYLN